MQEGAAVDAVPGTTAVAEIAVAVGESRSRSRSRSRLRARSRSLLGSVAALWFSGEAIACLLAVTVLRVLHLVASGAFIFFRGGVAVAASPVSFTALHVDDCFIGGFIRPHSYCVTPQLGANIQNTHLNFPRDIDHNNKNSTNI